jgi:hypothetical protein
MVEDKDLKWLGIDFDCVIANNSGHPDYTITTPLEGAKEYLDKIEQDGYKITIYTARGWAMYEEIETFLNKHQIPFRRIICGKPLFRWVIDDRNISFDGDWKKAYNKIT